LKSLKVIQRKGLEQRIMHTALRTITLMLLTP